MIDDIQTDSAPKRKKKTYTPPTLQSLDSVEDTEGKTAHSVTEAGPFTNPS